MRPGTWSDGSIPVTRALRATARMSWRGHLPTAAARPNLPHQGAHACHPGSLRAAGSRCGVLMLALPGKAESVGGLPDRITACLLDIDVARPFPPLRAVHRLAVSCPELPEAATSCLVPPGERGGVQRLERR